jgi:hypothetical protein
MKQQAGKLVFDPDLHLEALALEHHARWCRRSGVPFAQPSSIDVVEDSVVLRNTHGVIAEFSIVQRKGRVALRRTAPAMWTSST